MSGIVGIGHGDGAPVDARLLADMTDSLCFRGPDRRRVWIDGNIGFGHTLLATTDDAWNERQPCTVDGEVWITADARVDGREDLVRQLRARGCMKQDGANDAELLLHAYQAWGEQCLDHVLGDFAFAIWDRRARRLFCARDHFGVKPFFYSQCGESVIFSNTLNCIRRHPAVSDTLDDLAIADYLMFKYQQEPGATAFRDIRRLPPAHSLTWSPGASPTVRPYWALSLDAEIRYRTAGDYVDHFREAFTAAVRDRLRTGRVAISLSGGLDSSMVAATATQLSSGASEPCALRAHTVVYDRLIPDVERKYATIVADSLGIPIEFLVADAYPPFEGLDRPGPDFPEPRDPSFLALGIAFRARIAAHSRVLLTGHDADGLLRENTARHFATLLQTGRLSRFAADLIRHFVWLRTCPPIGGRTAIRRWLGPIRTELPLFPEWLDESLVARLNLRSRWREVWRQEDVVPIFRPRAVGTVPLWVHLFEYYDSGLTGDCLEYRHPFADLRVVRYLLAIPVVPWCIEKTLLRLALKGVVPEIVRRRPKTTLRGNPLPTALRQDPHAAGVDSFAPVPLLACYVNQSSIPRVSAEAANDDIYPSLRPWYLNRWMTHAIGSFQKNETWQRSRKNVREREVESVDR
jgi:asparagine synthase (glutamine-hydrolysing)